MTDTKHFFSHDGPLSTVISGYQPRAAQLEMADAIADAIASKQNLIAEAGTGTGKPLPIWHQRYFQVKKP